MFAYERTSTVSSQHQRGGMTRSCKKKITKFLKSRNFIIFFQPFTGHFGFFLSVNAADSMRIFNMKRERTLPIQKCIRK